MTEEEAKKIYCRPATEQEIDHRNYPGGETRIEFIIAMCKACWKADEKGKPYHCCSKGTVQTLFSIG